MRTLKATSLGWQQSHSEGSVGPLGVITRAREERLPTINSPLRFLGRLRGLEEPT